MRCECNPCVLPAQTCTNTGGIRRAVKEDRKLCLERLLRKSAVRKRGMRHHSSSCWGWKWSTMCMRQFNGTYVCICTILRICRRYGGCRLRMILRNEAGQLGGGLPGEPGSARCTCCSCRGVCGAGRCLVRTASALFHRPHHQRGRRTCAAGCWEGQSLACRPAC